jgi:hypothetical protein
MSAKRGVKSIRQSASEAAGREKLGMLTRVGKEAGLDIPEGFTLREEDSCSASYESGDVG